MRHLLILLVVASALCAQEPKKQDKAKLISGAFTAPAVSYQVPSTWKLQKNRSTMRLGTWRLPGKGDVDVVVYFFGAGGGGGVEANFARWAGQVESKAEPTKRKMKTKGGTVHLIDTSGTYVAPVRPGARDRNNKPDHRLLGAYVDVKGGPLYVKVIGPSKVVSAEAAAIEAFLKSMKPAKKK